MTVVVIIIVCLAAALLAVLCGIQRVSSYTPPVRADEVHTVTTPDLWRIRLCRYKPAEGKGEPIFLCHGFMSNQFNWSSIPGASAVDALVKRGYDCWAIDLRGNQSSIPPFRRTLDEPTFDDYLCRDIPAAIDYIRKATGYAKVHWVGHSMGGMLLYAYDAAFGSKLLASATTLGSPIGFEGVKVNPRMAQWGLAFLRFSRRLVRASQWLFVHIGAPLRLENELVPLNWDNMTPKANARNLFNMLEAPPIPVAEEMYRSVENKEWRVKNGQVDVFDSLKKLHVPLFAIFGSGDPFVPVNTAESFFKNISKRDKKLLVLSKENGHVADYSHVDLVYGIKAETEVFEPIVEWLQAHSIKERIDIKKDGTMVVVKAPPSRKKKQAAKKAVVKKVAAKKAPSKKTVAQKAVAKKAPAKKTAAKKAVAKKAPAKKTVAKKTPAKKVPAKKTSAKKRRA